MKMLGSGASSSVKMWVSGTDFVGPRRFKSHLGRTRLAGCNLGALRSLSAVSRPWAAINGLKVNKF